MKRFLHILAAGAFWPAIQPLPAFAAEVVIRSGEYAFAVDSGTLAIEADYGGRNRVLISAPMSGPGNAAELRSSPDRASWKLPGTGLSVVAQAIPRGLEVRIISSRVRDLVWPTVRVSRPVEAFILPLGEGAWVPASDRGWAGYLSKRVGRTALSEAFSMPFVGLDCAGKTLTAIFETPLDCEVTFSSRSKGLGMDFTRSFSRLDAKKEHVVRFVFGPDSPVEPARAYRSFLIEKRALVTLEEKVAHAPKARRIPGAIHAYLWGFKSISPSDIRVFPGFCSKLRLSPRGGIPSTARRIFSLLKTDARKEVHVIAESRRASRYSAAVVARDLGRIMQEHSLYDPEAWTTMALPEDIRKAAGKWESMTPGERVSFNAALLCKAYPRHFKDPEEWGDGISPRFLKMLSDSGVDRAVLILNDLDEGDSSPETARTADSLDYLYGAYDSYHSIHRASEKDTWTTAQFGDPDLYEKGAVTAADGKFPGGFMNKGRLLSPPAARPSLEKRVASKMKLAPFSAWFVDCDAAGQYFENYSRDFRHTREQDLRARVDRMDWIARTFNAPVGSEGGFALATPALYFAHGVMTPYFGWGDQDLSNRESAFWLGGYWPPEEPALFFKTAPVKPVFRKPLFDPAFRLPLYQVVFHDCVVSTHHWQYSSLKFEDVYRPRALLEQLYNVPPLYHLTREEFKRQGGRILEHYRFFSPLHRRLAFLSMTDFAWLSEDRLLQRTTFADGTRIYANFGRKESLCEGIRVPALTAVALLPGGEKSSYSPAAKP